MGRHAGCTGAACLLLAACGVSASTPGYYVSPEEQVPVLELYTSHGCSSCPPADTWLRRLADRPGLWMEFIPLAFHVDYWDSLGWPDRFASRIYSSRQRQYRQGGWISSVYTPGFVLGGREWRGWFRDREPTLSPGSRVGRLSLELNDGPRALIRFSPVEAVTPGRLTAHLAILGFGLTTQVSACENRGRDLEEDFVVLGYRSSRRSASASEWEMTLPDVVPVRTTRQAIVAWVSVDVDPTPLQAVAGWLPSGFNSFQFQ